MTYMAPDDVVTKYERLCHSVAAKLFKNTTEWHEYDDLLQEAYIALLDANERYEPSRGDFRKYVYHHVLYRVIDEVRKSGPQKHGHRVGDSQDFTPPDSMEEILEGSHTDPFWLGDPAAQEAFEETLDRVADVQAIEGFLRYLYKTESMSQLKADIIETMAHDHLRTLTEVSEVCHCNGSRVSQVLSELEESGAEYRQLLDA